MNKVSGETTQQKEDTETQSHDTGEEWERDDWKIVRAMKWQESELTNHRISWMVTFHGLLVAAFAFAWATPRDKPLLIGFCLVGILVSISSFLSLLIGENASRNLKKWWEENGPDYPSAPPLLAFDAKKSWIFPDWIKLFPWHFWPVLTAFGWFVLLLYTCFGS